MSGLLAQDAVTLGPLTVPGQVFGEVTDQKGTPFAPGAFSGILGLAYPSIAVEGAVPIFDNMMLQRLLPANLVSFYLSRDAAHASALVLGAAAGGTNVRSRETPWLQSAPWAMFWRGPGPPRAEPAPRGRTAQLSGARDAASTTNPAGGVEPSFYHGNLSYLPTVSQTYWEIFFDRIEVGGEPLPVCQLAPYAPTWGPSPGRLLDLRRICCSPAWPSDWSVGTGAAPPSTAAPRSSRGPPCTRARSRSASRWRATARTWRRCRASRSSRARSTSR